MFGGWGVDAPLNYAVPSAPDPCQTFANHTGDAAYTTHWVDYCNMATAWPENQGFKDGVKAYNAERKKGSDHTTAMDAYYDASGKEEACGSLASSDDATACRAKHFLAS